MLGGGEIRACLAGNCLHESPERTFIFAFEQELFFSSPLILLGRNSSFGYERDDNYCTTVTLRRCSKKPLAVLQQAGVIHIQMTLTLVARDSCSHLHDSSSAQLEKKVLSTPEHNSGMITHGVRHSAKLVIPP